MKSLRKMLQLDQNALFFIGEKITENKIEISEATGFYDALHMSVFPKVLAQNNNYQYIPLLDSDNIALFIDNDNFKKHFQLCIHNQSLHLFVENHDLSQEEALKMLSNFLIKREKKLLFITDSNKSRILKVKKDYSLVHVSAKEAE
jgi:uncharacterized membrane protein